MKQVKIYFRSVITRTKWRNYRWKEEKQYVVEYDGKTYANCDARPTDERLKKPFEVIYNSTLKRQLKNYIIHCICAHDSATTWLKDTLIKILEGTI